MEKSSPLIPPAAVAVPLLALLALILDLPPIVWHIRNRNIAASSLVFWVIIINFINFINAIIWPTDNIETWWNGRVFCDIQVKLIVAAGIGSVGSIICVMRGLAKVLDTENTILAPSQGQKRKELIISLVLCVGLPVYMMPIQYIVQPTRYWITTVAGCTAPVDRSWPSIVLLTMWPTIFSVVAVYYSGMFMKIIRYSDSIADRIIVLVIHRMRKYRKNFSSILSSSNSNLTKNRFLRLFFMSLIMVAILFPVEVYVLYDQATHTSLAYSWDLVHSEHWGDIVLIPTGGNVVFEHWIQVVYGYIIFAFTGMGHDAQELYRKWLLYVGLGKIFPSLHQSRHQRRNLSTSQESNSSSFGSRARLIIKRVSWIPIPSA